MINRVWLLNEPSGEINTAQQYQIAVGYPLGIELIEVPVIDENLEYYRRYLNDPIEVKPLIPTIPVLVVEQPLEISKYLRRYLNDPLTVEPLVPTAPVLEEVEVSEMSHYLRRYLNDPRK